MQVGVAIVGFNAQVLPSAQVGAGGGDAVARQQHVACSAQAHFLAIGGGGAAGRLQVQRGACHHAHVLTGCDGSACRDVHRFGGLNVNVAPATHGCRARTGDLNAVGRQQGGLGSPAHVATRHDQGSGGVFEGCAGFQMHLLARDGAVRQTQPGACQGGDVATGGGDAGPTGQHHGIAAELHVFVGRNSRTALQCNVLPRADADLSTGGGAGHLRCAIACVVVEVDRALGADDHRTACGLPQTRAKQAGITPGRGDHCLSALNGAGVLDVAFDGGKTSHTRRNSTQVLQQTVCRDHNLAARGLPCAKVSHA